MLRRHSPSRCVPGTLDTQPLCETHPRLLLEGPARHPPAADQAPAVAGEEVLS